MAKGEKAKEKGGGPKESANEVWTLVRDYAKQETVEPLKGLLNFAKWGLIGSLLVGIGVLELVTAVLRASQIETGDVFDGRWSFVPYVITLAVAGIVLLLTKRAMTARKAKAA